MKIAIVHGQNHKGSTYTITKQVVEKLEKKVEVEQIKEFFLPRDFNQPCLGCFTCFQTDLTHCPHYSQLQNLVEAIEEANLLVFDSPVYVFHATGQMMSFLDHFGSWWVVHRPKSIMTTKQAIVICSAAGGGMKGTIKDIADSLEMWGISKVYSLGIAVQASKPSDIPEKIQNKISKKADELTNKVIKGMNHRGMSLKAKFFFYLIRMSHSKSNPIEPDYSYWENQGWHGKKRPWRDG